MEYYPFLETKNRKTGFAVIFFVMILLARDTLITCCLVGFYPSQLTVAGLIILLGVVFLAVNRNAFGQIIRDRRILAFAMAAVLILLPMVFKLDPQLMYFSVLLCIFFAILLTYFVTLKEVAGYYVVMMTVLAAYSVCVLYIGRIPADRGLVEMPTFINAGGRDFYNFLLSFVSIKQVKYRNFGIFREPGVYQYFLILALFLHNYILQWDRKWKFRVINIILMVTALTTFSTNGVLETCLLMLVIFIDRKLYRNKKILITAIVLAVLAAVGIAAIMLRGGDLAFTLKQMVAKLYTLNRSSSARLNAVVVDAGFFLKNPIFGGKIATVLESVEFNTTSTMLMFAMFGILGGSLHLVSWLALVWEKGRRFWVNLILLILMLMSFNTQNLIADVFFWLFPVMALVERGIPLLERSQKKG